MESKKSRLSHSDDLLAFGGRPSLYYPAVRTASEEELDESSPFPHRLARGLGTAKFLCGACLALLGGMAVYVQVWSAWMYGGIWSGLFAIFTGLCIVLAARKTDGRQSPRKALLIALLLLSVLGFFNTGLLATFTAMGLVAEVYMEDVAGALVWKGVENASPFTVQLLLLATATADCLLSLACCVISGRQVCCCGKPTPALVVNPKQDRLINWLGSQQYPQALDPSKVPATHLPPVKLVPSERRTRSRPRTPSTMRVFPPPGEINESVSSSTTTRQTAPLVRADELGKRQSSSQHRSNDPRRKSRDSARTDAKLEDPDERPITIVNDRYLALDRQLSEEFIERSLYLERSRQSSA